MTVAFWFTRDLRLQDNAALTRAVEAAKASNQAKVLPFYVLDRDDFAQLAPIRQHSLVESLRALRHSIGTLTIFATLTQAAEALLEQDISYVFKTAAFDPNLKAQESDAVAAFQKNNIQLVSGGSFYAVSPGSVRKPDDSNYRVYTPFYRAWREIGWPAVIKLPADFEWINLTAELLPEPSAEAPFRIIAGEEFALRTWNRFKERALNNYDEWRNRADLSGTSHLSHALAFGEIHPRTLLAELNDSKAHEVFRKEIAWREFYADILHHRPDTTTEYYEPRFAKMRYDVGAAADAKLIAWQQGKTGYPMVDAGMRQLLAEGWMHNRVRMIVASFFVKDLHLEWQQGAAWFERHLSDFDPASNAHGWQWTAGCGTDASPYYRVFNPVLQGLKFDPNGNYVRKYIPELRHLAGADVHTPWQLIDGLSRGYVAPIIEHDQERHEALARLEEHKNLS